MELLTVGPTFDPAKNKINKISLLILGIRNSEIWLFDDVSKILDLVFGISTFEEIEKNQQF